MDNETKDLAYYRANAEENYLTTPISVLMYIQELEKALNGQEQPSEVKKAPTTYRECLEALPDGYRELALANAEENGWVNLNPTGACVDKSYAISRCFPWMCSPQGYLFWAAVYNHYEKGTDLPKLPNN